MAETAAQSVVKVTGIHHISIPCNDLQRAIRFYTEVLGMEFVRIIEGDTAPHFLGTNLPAGLQQVQTEYIRTTRPIRTRVIGAPPLSLGAPALPAGRCRPP